MQTLHTGNLIIGLVFSLCCAYQLVYLLMPLVKKDKPLPPSRGEHEFAVLICARNEEKVIGSLLESLRRQTYPGEKLHVFVMADNCDDGTEAAARAGGARVYTRRDKAHVGKGYALEALLGCLRADYPQSFDGYFVFDATTSWRRTISSRWTGAFPPGRRSSPATATASITTPAG